MSSDVIKAGGRVFLLGSDIPMTVLGMSGDGERWICAWMEDSVLQRRAFPAHELRREAGVKARRLLVSGDAPITRFFDEF